MEAIQVDQGPWSGKIDRMACTMFGRLSRRVHDDGGQYGAFNVVSILGWLEGISTTNLGLERTRPRGAINRTHQQTTSIREYCLEGLSASCKGNSDLLLTTTGDTAVCEPTTKNMLAS